MNPGRRTFNFLRERQTAAMKNLKDMVSNPVALSVLMILFGIILFVWPGATLNTVIVLLGAGLALGGAFTLFSWYRHRQGSADYVGCTAGLAALLGGVFVLSSPQTVKDLVPTLLGLGILVTGVVNLVKALDQRRMRFPRWGVSAALAGIAILISLFLISRASFIMDTIVRAVGVMVVYNGVSSFWIATRKY